MKLLIFVISMFTSLQFAHAVQDMETVKQDVATVLEHCDAMNPVFTYRCVQWDLEEIRNSLSTIYHVDEINWLNDLLSCYPKNFPLTRGEAAVDRIKHHRGFSIHSDRRYARRVVKCVADKANSN